MKEGVPKGAPFVFSKYLNKSKNWVGSMKSFKQFIQEMPTLLKKYDKKTYQIPDHVAHSLHKDFKYSPNYKQIGTHGDYQIWGDKSNGRFTAIHAGTGHAHMYLDGAFEGEKPNEFHINELQGHPDSGIRAHELYHHLVTKHGIELHSSDEMSQGGSKTWKRLASNYPDVEVKHVDDERQEKAIPSKWDSYHSDTAKYTHFVARKKR